MRRNEISGTGIVDQNGKLQMFMGEINDFLAQNKGRRIVATFHAVPMASSEAMRAYYYKVIVPHITRAAYEQGERMTQMGMDKWLREMSPVCLEETVNYDTGEYITRLREIGELDNAELMEHIDYLKQMAAENYNVVLEDPRTL